MTVIGDTPTTTTSMDGIVIDEETALLTPSNDSVDAPSNSNSKTLRKRSSDSDLEYQHQHQRRRKSNQKSKEKGKGLPKLQIAVVLLLQLCEPLMSQSIYPYINQLVGELDITGGDERKVGYYAGLIESLFFATEAMTVLQWSRFSDHIGRKPVLLIGLIGSTLSMLCFGLSRTFWTLVISRCLCGLLNGNIGVMKSVMGELTDSSNRAEGFALMPVVWATGSTLGPLLGGSLSKPYDNFPSVFKSPFWKDYPYFLPCLATSCVAFIVIIFTAVFFKETVPKHKRGRSIFSEMTLTEEEEEEETSNLNEPLPLRKILIYPVLISISNYVFLAFINIMLNALLPLFLAMPIQIGGLGFSPSTIGYIWGVYGFMTGLFNIVFFAKVMRRFGERKVFFGGMMMFGPCFMLMPVMSLCAKKWGVGVVVWMLIVIVFFMLVIMDMSYGSIFMYVTASAPNKRSLGATNGLSQMTVSIARAIGPALSTSLFSYSVQKNILGGYGVYLCMTVLSLLGLLLAVRLPEHVWEEKEV
ncbi:hypothetical protein Agabi119p4_5357 [Agaricus bisporus var. burnettii]|uniref:Major facilitator superfamily (MFS) profile domain-containing protein n=1 Tax=Agaricus bisporus var. burnettii TaxID=192524 RepID=A0A8H7F1G6_AGABI|nr:hypothetical protein Agabi119p4_5357 [Agaricus bisporus var. burnettii]